MSKWLFLIPVVLFAQAPVRFEVATIKPSDPNARAVSIGNSGTNRLALRNITLLGLVNFAYGDVLGFNPMVQGGPAWVNQTRYDVEGQAPAGPVFQGQYQAMLKTLLAERFALKTHTDAQEENVYALVAARGDKKLGPKVSPWDGKCNGREAPPPQTSPLAARCGAYYRSGLNVQGGTMTVLADMLSSEPLTGLGRIVVDRTGIPGEFNLVLDYPFPPPATPELGVPSLFTAIQEQLGLKLEPAKGTRTVLVIDDTKPPTEN
jgi:uncharacterized protein (TIGR03435 family)